MIVKTFDIGACSAPVYCGCPGYYKITDFRNGEYLVFNESHYLEYGGYVVAHGDRFNLTDVGIDYIQAVIDRANALGSDLFDIELMPLHFITN